jgi:hypothetical protein
MHPYIEIEMLALKTYHRPVKTITNQITEAFDGNFSQLTLETMRSPFFTGAYNIACNRESKKSINVQIICATNDKMSLMAIFPREIILKILKIKFLLTVHVDICTFSSHVKTLYFKRTFEEERLRILDATQMRNYREGSCTLL